MKKIGIFGLGNMGEAMVKTFLAGGVKHNDIVACEIKKERADYIKKIFKIDVTRKPLVLIEKASFIVLAVKPQDAKELLKEIAPALTDAHIFCSVMAGITTANILSLAGKPVKVIRAMPNIAVKVGEGAIGLTSNSLVTKADLSLAKKLMSNLGRVVEVGEDLMDAVTALSGSGPAFFLLFLEAMIDAGVKAGIPRDKSNMLSLQVIKGVLTMLEKENVHPTLMREMITSPGGTTIAGLAVLEEKGFKGCIIKAIEEAQKRSKELSL